MSDPAGAPYTGPPPEESVELNGVSINFRVDGPALAPPIALVNGALTNLHFFTPLLPLLLPEFRLVRHDWRGSGCSGPAPRASYCFEQYADDLAALLDHLGIERAIVCGMAYGARTAARFALRHPGRLNGLALYDVSLDQPVDQNLQRAGNAEARHLRDEAGLPSPEVDRRWFAHLDQREARRSLTAHVDVPDPTDQLRVVDHPTLVACGRQDVNLPEAERIAGLLPNARLEIMEMAGHGSVLSRPDLFARLLGDFVREARVKTG